MLHKAMKVTLLGTGTSQGVPVIACNCSVCRSEDPRDRRLRSAALVQTDEGKNILIDIGPDFREQMLRNNVRHLDAILLTHAHRDHVGGLDDISQRKLIDEVLNNIELNLIVTPTEIDFLISKLSKLIADSINETLHRQITY